MKMNFNRQYFYEDMKNCLNLMETHWYVKELTLSKGLTMSESFIRTSIDTLKNIVSKENEDTIYNSYHYRNRKTIDFNQFLELDKEYSKLKERAMVTLNQYETLLEIKTSKEVI